MLRLCLKIKPSVSILKAMATQPYDNDNDKENNCLITTPQGTFQCHFTCIYRGSRLRVLDSPQLTYLWYINKCPPWIITKQIDHEWVGSFSSLDRISREEAYGLTSLSKKMRRSNHLQMLEQRLHLLLDYFKTLSVGPASLPHDRVASYQLG